MDTKRWTDAYDASILEAISRDQHAWKSSLVGAREVVEQFAQRAETDGDVLREVLFWHGALLPEDLIVQVVAHLPEGLEAQPETLLLRVILGYHLEHRCDDEVRDWAALRDMLTPLVGEMAGVLGFYVQYHRFLLARHLGMPTQLIDRLYLLAESALGTVGGPRHQMLAGLLLLSRARQQRDAGNKEECWRLCREAVQARFRWLLHLADAEALGRGDYRVVHAAKQVEQAIEACDRFFGTERRDELLPQADREWAASFPPRSVFFLTT